MRRFESRDEVRASVGEELGVSGWLEITQADVDAFAHVTGDRAPVHVDSAYAAGSPFGGTIAHGLLTLSLGPALIYELADFAPLGQNLNYGYEKVRFPAPLPAGSRVRMHLTLRAIEEVAGAMRLILVQTFEREGGARPVCVAEGVIHVMARSPRVSRQP